MVRDLENIILSPLILQRLLQHREVVHGVRLGVASVVQLGLDSARVVQLDEVLRHG